MAKRKAGYLEVPLDEGEHLKLNLKRHKIATCYDLRRYLRTLCSPERLQIRGQELKVLGGNKASRTSLNTLAHIQNLLLAALGSITRLGGRPQGLLPFWLAAQLWERLQQTSQVCLGLSSCHKSEAHVRVQLQQYLLMER